MAKVMKKETSLHKRRNKNILINLISIILIISSILAVYYYRSFLISIIVILLSVISIIISSKKIHIYNYGIKGEKKVSKILSKLPKEYLIYNDITVYNAQIDHLVISPYGVYCIETKHMKGRIIGKEYEKDWIQRKRGKKGGIYDEKFYNPCKQSMGHVLSLKDFFSKNGIKGIWIQSIVVFYGNKTILSTDTEKTPVITEKKLLKYIKSNCNQNININRIEKIVNMLSTHL